jgi:hypothetical protein
MLFSLPWSAACVRASTSNTKASVPGNGQPKDALKMNEEGAGVVLMVGMLPANATNCFKRSFRS